VLTLYPRDKTQNNNRGIQTVVYKKSERTSLSLHLLCVLPFLTPGVVLAQEATANSTGALTGISQPQFNQWQLRAQQNEELYIPPTAQRPLGEDAGPIIQVTSLRLDIDPQLRQEISVELNERLNLMLSARATEYLAQGFTIGRLESVAADITGALREAGFILAWAYLPEQNIQNDTVVINVLPGSLNAITADGNNRYSTARLIRPFSDLIGSPVHRTAIENSILHVRNYPGLSTSAVFSPGADVGTSQLTLRVSEDPFDMLVAADNHGTESTGENRLRSDLFWYNPFGRGDIILINAVQTFDPAENLYGGLTYQTPFIRHDLTLTLAFSHNAFEVAAGTAAGAGEDGKNLAGDTNIGSIGLNKNLRLTRRSRMDVGFDLSGKNAVLENLPSETEDNLTVASLYFAAEGFDGFGAGGINQFEFRYSSGIPDFLGSMSEDGDGGQSTRTGSSGANAGGDFDKFTLRYQRLQRLSQRNSLLFRSESQISDDLLTSLELFVIGGPNSVRAYPIDEFLGDEGSFASLEWIVDIGRADSDTTFSLSAYGDYAYGRINEPLANEVDDTDLSGWGIGISMGHTGDSGNQFALRFDVASPITDIEPSDGDDPQFYGQISYTFR
jgi:hemolysin activation/secretion protein